MNVKAMDVVWYVSGLMIMLAGLAGCILPFLPGPPLCFIALLIQQLKEEPPFSAKFLWIWAAITLVITIADYVIPLYGTKKFGGTTHGMWGCTLGLIAGLFFPPWGIVIGPFIGAFVGELMANSNSNRAFKAALGSFTGFLLGTLLKLIACFVMGYYLVVSL